MPAKPPEPFRHIRRFIAETPWAALPSAVLAVVEIVERRAAGIELEPAELAARLEAARRSPRPAAAPGAIAVIPIHGLIAPRANALTDISGATTAEGIAEAFKAAIADPNVASILFDVDSPGGAVHGIPELASLIAANRGAKPVVAQVQHTAASAAYWIAAQADEIVASPSSDLGSIGVFTVHDDLSAMAEKEGVRRTYISSSPEKVEGNPFGPLSDSALAHLQERVDASADVFVRHVASGRNVSLETVRETFGRGRMVRASTAVQLGMADRVATFDDTVARLSARAAKAAGHRAEAPEAPLVADSSTAPDAPQPAADDARDRLALSLAVTSSERRT